MRCSPLADRPTARPRAARWACCAGLLLACSGGPDAPLPGTDGPALRAPEGAGPPPGAPPGPRPEASPPRHVTVLAVDPDAPGPAALAAALGAARAPWTGDWPPPRPGELWALWWAEGSPETLRALVQPGPPRPDGLLVIAPPGLLDEQGWRPRTEVRVSVLDPVELLQRWGAPPPTPPPALLAAVAAQAIGAHFALSYTPPLTSFSGIDLGGLDPGIRGTLALAAPRPDDDARARRASPTAADPDVAVRLAAAATGGGAPALIADPEPLVRARAARHLREPGALEAALRDPSSFVRVAAAQALVELGRGGAPEAARAGLRLAAAHPDAYLRWKAAAGLGGDAQGLPTLTAMLHDVDIDVRREAALSLASAPPGAPGWAEAGAALRRAATDPNSFVQRRALEALSAFPGPETTATLEGALQSPTALVAAAAAQSLARLGRPAPQPRAYAPPARPRDQAAALAALANPDAVAQKDLCKLIAGEPWAAEALRPLLRHPDSELRKAAVDALGRSPSATPDLLAALHDTDPDTVVTALVSLAALSQPDPEPYLPFLAHPDAELRLRAAEALAAALRAPARPTPSPAARAAVAQLSRDPDERIAAALAPLDPSLDPAALPSVLGRRALAAEGRLAADEAQLLVLAAAPGADPALQRWAESVIGAEDYLLHVIFSWNLASTRPGSHWVLRPWPHRPFGQPNRG